MFDEIEIFKSEINTPDLAIVYIYCKEYNINFNRDILKKLRDGYILFDKEFLYQHIADIDYIYEKINIGMIKSIKKKQPKHEIPDISKKIEYD
ncbi:putative orfan [Tupanvirus soda lake]|uniref:Orfan n=2 Tax=Tupanvirus TaxID=2094720 RepID=A0AC62AB50_9VIRU|nr:putative orfan [Tupanvirus soda lake]QKU34875.1 putative orfan [Tupanvirus soda lake]